MSTPGLSISDAIGDSNQSSVLSNDPKTLRAEVAQLRRQVEKIHAARFTPLHPKETVKNIFFGQSYSLELYKSFTDKIALIDEALELGDGNAILAVSIFNIEFVQQTKKPVKWIPKRQLFYRLICDKMSILDR